MPVSITDVDAFTTPVQAPDDGDPGNGATFQLAPQGLANRTRYLLNLLRAGVWDYAAPIEVIRRVPLSKFLPTSPTSILTREAAGSILLEDASMTIVANLNDIVPQGATITTLYGAIDPAAARTGTNRVRWELRKVEASETQVAETYDNGTSDVQAISIDSIGELVNLATTEYKFRITAGNTGSDRVHNAYVAFTVPGRRLA